MLRISYGLSFLFVAIAFFWSFWDIPPFATENSSKVLMAIVVLLLPYIPPNKTALYKYATSGWFRTIMYLVLVVFLSLYWHLSFIEGVSYFLISLTIALLLPYFIKGVTLFWEERQLYGVLILYILHKGFIESIGSN